MSENVETFENEEQAEVKERLDEVRGAVAGLAGEVKGQLGRKVEGVKETVQSRAGQASSVARERYSDARDGLRTGYERARKDLDQLGGDVNAYVRDNPGRSVLIAAGVGFVVGLLLRGGDRS